MTNPAVTAMLAKAGFYAVSGDGFVRGFTVVEVEADGTCHQLRPALGFARDGQLLPDGWAECCDTIGPFGSPAEADAHVEELWKRRAEVSPPPAARGARA